MGKYNKYAVRFDDFAKAVFKELREANAALAAAEDAKRRNSQRYDAEGARAQANYLDAVQRKRDLDFKIEYEYPQKIKSIRAELRTAIESDFSVNPAKVDANALELLKSGVMNASEYAAMLATATANGNATMARLIGKYAEDAAETVSEKSDKGFDDPQAVTLREIGRRANEYNGGEWLNAFDYMVNTYNKAIANAPMIDSWDDLCGNTVESF